MAHRSPGAARQGLPIATIATLIVTATVTGLQSISPEVLSALRRNPAGLAAGEWWRLVTPLFVHADGWTQIVVNLVGIALVGPAVERLFGSARWLVLYFASGVAAEAISYAWDPYGAGASIALCGLIGGLLVWVLLRNGSMPVIAVFFALSFVAALAGYAMGGIIAVALLAGLLGIVLRFLFRQNSAARVVARLGGIAGLLGGLALTVLRDNHGPPIIIGACLAALLLRPGVAHGPATA